METLEMIVPRKVDASAQFSELYERCFPVVARFVSKMRGSFEDAKDIFQDALVIYHEKSLTNDLDIRTTPEAYILGIAKHLWSRKFKDRQKIATDDLDDSIAVPHDYYPTVNDNLLLRFLETTGEKCLALLRFFYFEESSAKELQQRFGYQSEHSASVQKYKCIEKLRETIKQKSIAYEDFLE
jgi:RNA polymerase sigma factor (sigma-70 family)